MKLFLKSMIILSLIFLTGCSYTAIQNSETTTATTTPSSSPILTEESMDISSLTGTTLAVTAEATEENEIAYTHERTDEMPQIKIIIYKSKRTLYVFDGNTMLKEVKIALSQNDEGHKQKEGDGKTPEGTYYVCTRNDKSKYYLALGISYPNIEDAKAGLESGLISQSDYDKIEDAIENGVRPPWDTALGGEIMIHGSDISTDWTQGCIATLDSDMDYLWEMCPLGTPVIIYP